MTSLLVLATGSKRPIAAVRASSADVCFEAIAKIRTACHQLTSVIKFADEDFTFGNGGKCVIDFFWAVSLIDFYLSELTPDLAQVAK